MNAAVNGDGGGDMLGPLAQVGLLSPGMVLAVALAGLLLALVACVLGLLAVRRVRRSRLWSYGVLALRSQTGTGASAELAALRLQLRRATDATDAAHAGARSTGELSETAASLIQTARAVDGQLRTAQRDPDPGTTAAALAALRPQVEQLVRSAATIRQEFARAGEATTANQLERHQGLGSARSAPTPQDARPETPQDAVRTRRD